jgi:hypothetical protein
MGFSPGKTIHIMIPYPYHTQCQCLIGILNATGVQMRKVLAAKKKQVLCPSGDLQL